MNVSHRIGKEEISSNNTAMATLSKTAAVVDAPFAVANPEEDDAGVIAAPAPTERNSSGDDATPTHIPVESSGGRHNVEVEEDDEEEDSMNYKKNTVAIENNRDQSNGEDDYDDDESEYEYEDDDDAAFSGFLMSAGTHGTNSGNTAAASSSQAAPAQIIEEDTAIVGDSVLAGASSTDVESEAAGRKKWREPTREAVNMSLRAQQETSGSKRRLAQDLYRIMNQDTEEAGFSLAPKSEDSMDLWTIKLFQFDEDSNLAKDMMVVGINHIELEMKFPEQYPFEPPFVRVVKPRFKRQTGFVMNGALCMELLTKDGWNPINDIESVIVSIRSLLVVGDGRLVAATELSDSRYEAVLKAAQEKRGGEGGQPDLKKARLDGHGSPGRPNVGKGEIGSYTAAEAQSAYSHLSDYHKKKGWDTSGWWARKG